MKSHLIGSRLIIAAFAAAAGLAAQAKTVTVRPVATDEPLVNPGMGLVYYQNAGRLWAYGCETKPGDTLDWFPGVSVIYFRMNWSEIEPREGEYHWEIIDSFAQPWIQKGKQIALRFASSMQTTNATPDYVREAGAKGAWFDWPPRQWGYKGKPYFRFWEPVFDDPVYLAKLEKFLKAFAARYDGDESVAFVDVGSIGLFGEGHTDGTVCLNEADTERVNRLHWALHRRVLPRTQLVISHSAAHPAALKGAADHPLLQYARSLGIGFRNDSVFCYPGKDALSWTDARWGRLFAPTLPVIIETGHYSLTVKPDEIMERTWRVDELVPCAEAFQASYFSIHGYADKLLAEDPAVYRELARRVGYRFELREASWPDVVKAGEKVPVAATWVNAGVTWCHQPCFAAWTLLDEKDNVVWTCVDEAYDFRNAYPKIDGTRTWDFQHPPKDRPPARERETKVVSSCRFGHDAPSVREDAVYKAAKALGWPAPDVWQMLKRGTYTLAVSIGTRQGTPKIALPLEGQVGTTRRYRLGKITVE